MRALLAAWLFAALLSAPTCGAELSVFYCYAPDAESGVVYQSQALPVGPVAERAGYGREFANYLRSSRRVRGDVTAYCVIRASSEEIARAQAALSAEPCAECAGATRFEPVNWPRERGGASAPRETQGSTSAPRPAAPASTTPPPSKTATALLVVLGNTETGKLLVVSSQADAVSVAKKQARLIHPTGWKTLLTTSEPGFGAAFCVRSGGEVRFFVAHAQSSIKEAISQARESAGPYAAETSQPAKICGAPWNAQAGSEEVREPGVIDDVKDLIRKEVACDPKAKAGDPAARPCPKPDPSFTGVRG